MTPKEMAEQFGNAMLEGVPVYLPAMKRLALAEFIALGESLYNKEKDAAYAILAEKMTLPELATEKELLAKLAELRATGRAEAIALADNILMGIFRTAFAILLTAGAL